MAVELTVMSYNIHHGEGRDGVIDLARLAAVISSQHPDLVALQEVDRFKRRTGNIDQVDELSRLTGMIPAYSVSIDSGQNGQYGNMVLSRLPILGSKTYALPGEPRSLLETNIDLSTMLENGSSMMFYSTHLDLQQTPRVQSINRIRKVLTSFPGRSAILAGDLNATPTSPTIRALQEFMQNATDSQDIVTFVDEDGKNGKQIDYVLYRPEQRWQLENTQVIEETTASDHFPLLAKFRLV